VPRGVTEVKDSFGVVVERGALNEESASILPESFRRYKTKLTVVGKAWLPGRYRLVTTYRADGIAATKSFETSFWYAGALIVWAVAGLALSAVVALVWRLWWWPRQMRRKK